MVEGVADRLPHRALRQERLVGLPALELFVEQRDERCGHDLAEGQAQLRGVAPTRRLGFDAVDLLVDAEHPARRLGLRLLRLHEATSAVGVATHLHPLSVLEQHVEDRGRVRL